MLLRCAARGMMAPAVMMAGLTVAAGAAMTLAAGAAAVGGAMLVKRMREERKGWREGAADPVPPEDIPPATPA